MKQYTRFLIVLVVAVIAYVLAIVQMPQEIDWTQNYLKDSKAPFGCYVLFNELSSLYSGQVRINDLPPSEAGFERLTSPTSLVFIAPKLNIGNRDLSALLQFVKRGNSVFLAASEFGPLLDSVGVKDISLHFSVQPINIRFVQKDLATDSAFVFPKMQEAVFHHIQSKSFTVLARADSDTVFVKIKFGKGAVYLCALPQMFGNYYILDTTTVDAAFRALSCLPKENHVIWDEYYKPGGASSPIQLIMLQPSLRWGYWLMLFTIILFLIFGGRRRQRALKTIPPLPNATLSFVKAVGELYYYSKDHKNIARKKMFYFRERLRTLYYLQGDEFSKENAAVISVRAGIPLRSVEQLLGYLRYMQEAEQIDKDELFEINTLIESFYKKANIHG